MGKDKEFISANKSVMPRVGRTDRNALALVYVWLFLRRCYIFAAALGGLAGSRTERLREVRKSSNA